MLKLILIFLLMTSMKNKKFIFLFFIFYTFSEELIDGIVAKVENNIILNSDVLQTLQIQAAQLGVNLSRNPLYIEENYPQALDFIINQNIIFELAKKDTLIEVSGDEISSTVDLEIEMMVDRAGSKIELENILDMSIQEYKMDIWDEIEKKILIEKYQQNYMSKIDITRPEVVSFYNTYSDSLPLIPSTSTFSIIEIPIKPNSTTEKNTYLFLKSIKDSILQNDNFEYFAKKYSEDPGSKQNGGDLGYILRGNLVREFEEVAFSLEEGQISDPVKTIFGYHLIKNKKRQGQKVHIKHILIQIKPTSVEVNETEKYVKNIYNETANNSYLFDSLAVEYQKKYNNLSGIYYKKNDDLIDKDIVELLNEFKNYPISINPIKSYKDTYYLIYIKNRTKEQRPSLENSWNLIENMAKNNKITLSFDMWINSEKEHIYIQKFK